ncbi:nuclear body protein SP140 isoform X12 [Rattus norvegicus]|uniref:nuclear body protein SP140 isoform X12 n=1 Tax=Rattus norvegicus TaxID=10116 RepID=UPI0019178FF8|nr:nuclear body protein SP140 isoform X9 [Rattus norvegicus]
MAGGDNGLSSRMIPENQNGEQSDDYQLMFKLFKENKVEIASAITKLFPFLMSLRDRDFISEQKYQECQETCKNLVPVDRVVYDILSDIQKKFSRDLLKVIFSNVHLKAYPDLQEILKHFLSVSENHRTVQRINGRDVEERPRLPAVVREASYSPGNTQMSAGQAEEVPSLPQCNGGDERDFTCQSAEGRSSPEQMCDGQEPQDNLPSSLRCEAASYSPGNTQMSAGQAEEVPSLPQCNGGDERDFTCQSAEGRSSPEQMCDGQEPQDNLPSSLRCEAASCSPGNTQTNAEQAEEAPSLPQCNGREGSSSCEQMCDGPDPQDELSSSLRRDTDGRRAVTQAVFRRKKMKNPGLSAKIRGPRRHGKEMANFNAELLPVTCGNLKGVLHKDKFKQGISVMSIQCQDGNWVTPPEFEIMGGHGRSKNWKLSLRCYNWPLKLLIQRNFLPIPPRIYGKRKKKRTQSLHHFPADPDNSDECEVCRDGGTLFCCDTCSRAFHEECHIPAVEAEVTPWSCIFCRMQSLGSQQSLPESEILQREMVPQEQLKCEYVLLRVYCCSESSFFSKMPYYYYERRLYCFCGVSGTPGNVNAEPWYSRSSGYFPHQFREMAVGVQEPMWLDIIKRKLSDQAYSQVEDFVQDMRLIFRNHRITFKDPKFGEMGLILESKFEKSFKEAFAIQGRSEKS